ncbi:adipokinetic hormone receptor [Rhodnius prolixus]|uniref:Adipokinetic hormone receptor n=2 Tax=Rhodnius TaxID=13248 RepID=A0A076PSE9_RHOPR|nr:adipokinetic hormone receptor [Rhodnius prolixus]
MTRTEEVFSFTFFPEWSEIRTEKNETYVIPPDMRFNEGHKLALAVYSLLMLISGVGNVWVLVRLAKSRRSRTNRMLTHLAIADLFVAFLMMPAEILSAATVAWWFGDIPCRIFAFFKTFGLYQSSFVLVCIGIDRYYAIVKPLSIKDTYCRGKGIVALAWVISGICSLPQVVVFREQEHYTFTGYKQCCTFNAFPTSSHEIAYSMYNMAMMYMLPLVVIIFCYGSIFIEIYRRTSAQNSGKLRRSTLGFLGRAKNRTLKLTITIILAFFICWTPYYIMALWYWLDRSTAEGVDVRVKRALFLFACTNSSINPLVYGVYQRTGCGPNNSRTSHNTCITELRQQRTNNHVRENLG